MRKKSKAQKYLERVEWIDSIVRNNLIEQKQWQDLALSITANMGGERVQSSGSKSKMADAVDHCVDAEDYILQSVQRLKAEKREIISTIEQVESPIYYNVLFKRYIQYQSLQEIADHYKRSYDWIKTTHGRAIAAVQRILDARYNSAEAGKTILDFQRQCEEVANKKLKADLDRINKKRES